MANWKTLPEIKFLPARRFHVGIDPDAQASGVAVWDCETKTFAAIEKMRVYALIKYVVKMGAANCILHVSAGWLNESVNFHEADLYAGMPERIKRASEAAKRAYIGRIKNKVSVDIGRNHQTGLLLCEIFTEMGFTVDQVRPFEKKWTPAYFASLTKLELKDQDLIDACVLVFNYQ